MGHTGQIFWSFPHFDDAQLVKVRDHLLNLMVNGEIAEPRLTVQKCFPTDCLGLARIHHYLFKIHSSQYLVRHTRPNKSLAPPYPVDLARLAATGAMAHGSAYVRELPTR